MKVKISLNLLLIISLVLVSTISLASPQTASAQGPWPGDIFAIGSEGDYTSPTVLRLDSEGAVVCQQLLPFTRMLSLQYAADRNLMEDSFYLIGDQYFNENQIDGKTRVLKYNSQCGIEWDVPVSPNTWSLSANAVLGGVFVTDRYEGVYRMDDDGNILWGPLDYGVTGGNFWTVVIDPTDGGAFVSEKQNSVVMKIDRDGNLKWLQTIPSPERLNPSLYDGGVYVGSGSYSANTYKLSADGTSKWIQNGFPSLQNEPRNINPFDGSLYVKGAWPTRFGRLASDGTVMWSVSTDVENNYAMAVEMQEGGDFVYTGERYNHLGITKMNASDGSVVWRRDPGLFTYSGGSSTPLYLVFGGIPSVNQPPIADETVFVPDSPNPFFIDKYEVTNTRYRECEDAGVCAPPVFFSSPTQPSYYDNPTYDHYPVIWLNWHDASDFCEWEGKRLPTEAEWHLAAYGTDGRPYPWGYEAPDCSRLNYNFCVGEITQVGSYPTGASAYGAMDMSGNMWEWTADWFTPNVHTYKVLRGSHLDYFKTDARKERRPEAHAPWAGFRCAMDPNSSPIVDTGGPYSSYEGAVLTLEGATASDPDDDLLTVNWSVNSGLCSFDSPGAINPNLTCSDDGSYEVTLTVSDGVNDPVSDSASVTVNDLSPTAAFTWSPNPQRKGLPVTFSDASSSYPDAIVDWDWDFSGLNTSSAQNPSYTFDNSGMYHVCLTVTDDDGSTDTICQEVPIPPMVCDTVLDDFNRPDGPVGSNWHGATGTHYYEIVNGELQVPVGGALYWKPTKFGPEQEACITLNQIGKRAHHSVMLKVQKNKYWRGNIEVFYDARKKKVGVDTTIPGIGETLLATWPMTLQAGDVLGGLTLADGTVEVHVNGVLIGTVDAGPFFVNKGGSIGLWIDSPKKLDPIVDDFAGK